MKFRNLTGLTAGMIFLIFLTTAASTSDEILEGISLAFRAGNAVELAKYFNASIELVILEEEDVYSKSQAEQIIRKFFTEHKPSVFKIIFKGGKETSSYAIGTLTTSNGIFRVYLLIKKKDDQPLIHQLRIEEEDEENQQQSAQDIH